MSKSHTSEVLLSAPVNRSSPERLPRRSADSEVNRSSKAPRSADRFQPARILPRYFSAPHHREVIVSGLEMLREICNQEAFRDPGENRQFVEASNALEVTLKHHRP